MFKRIGRYAHHVYIVIKIIYTDRARARMRLLLNKNYSFPSMCVRNIRRRRPTWTYTYIFSVPDRTGSPLALKMWFNDFVYTYLYMYIRDHSSIYLPREECYFVCVCVINNWRDFSSNARTYDMDNKIVVDRNIFVRNIKTHWFWPSSFF